MLLMALKRRANHCDEAQLYKCPQAFRIEHRKPNAFVSEASMISISILARHTKDLSECAQSLGRQRHMVLIDKIALIEGRVMWFRAFVAYKLRSCGCLCVTSLRFSLRSYLGTSSFPAAL